MKSPRGQGRGWREKQQLTKARNQQSEFSLCLHKLAPVLLAAGGGQWGVGDDLSLGNGRVAVLHMNEA